MKQPWAVILTALMLAGCRSSQPTTNPFMRTTVPPPGTQGMMVMPGEPYPAGTVPPVVTAPGAPAVVPVTPMPAQPAPVAAPPPKQEKFQPPGGSYLYHQSSNESPRAGPVPGGVQMASTPTPPGTVRQAAHFEQQSARPTATVVQQSSWQIRDSTADSRGDPPEKLASVTVGQDNGNSTVRIVGGSSDAGVPDSNSPGRQGVLHMTVDNSIPAATRVASGALSQPLASRVAIVNADTASQAAASFVSGKRDLAAVTKAAFQPVSNAGYAYAPDYRTLRGRLEYSQSQRRWKLRYIPIDGQTDAYGGSVVLGDFPSLASHKPGDMVTVRGALAGGNAASDGFSPRYELEAIEPLSR